ncbi:MAG: ABC transporter substrate-binding protein [Pseudomonadota bacterium]
MIERRHILRSGLALVALTAAPSVALADQVEDAEAFIEERGNKLLDILGMAPGDARRDAFRDWLNGSFNLNLIGKLALGPFLQQATPDQLEAYTKAFSDYIVVTYESRFDTFTGYNLQVLRGRPAGSKDSIVQTLISYGNDTFNVDFRVRQEASDDLDVIDVMVQNVSMLKTQQDEFRSVIQRSGLDGLIDGLKEQTAEIEAQAQS